MNISQSEREYRHSEKRGSGEKGGDHMRRRRGSVAPTPLNARATTRVMAGFPISRQIAYVPGRPPGPGGAVTSWRTVGIRARIYNFRSLHLSHYTNNNSF